MSSGRAVVRFRRSRAELASTIANDPIHAAQQRCLAAATAYIGQIEQTVAVLGTVAMANAPAALVRLIAQLRHEDRAYSDWLVSLRHVTELLQDRAVAAAAAEQAYGRDPVALESRGI